MKMAEFDYQWKYTLEKEDLENEEDKFECNEKRINEFLGQFKNKSWSFRKPSFKGKVCLDAGCGPGRWTCALQKLNAARVDSFDLSEEAIARCKKINPDAYVFNIMELKENKIYDFVLSWGVIHHTNDPRKAFSKLVSQLKKGGMLHVMVYEKKNDWFYEGYRGEPTEKRKQWKSLTMEKKLKLCKKFADEKGGNIHGWFDALNPEFNWSYTKEEIKEWFVEEGFSNIKEGNMKFNINMNGILE